MSQRDVEETRADLLERSMKLRDDLNTAVGKLDAYIEQLRAATPTTAEEPDGAPSPTSST